jgi:hypothetical protein
MGWGAAIIALACSITTSFSYWERFAQQTGASARRSMTEWAIKGLAVPLLLWIVFNSGLVGRVPYLMPQIEYALSRGGSGVRAFLHVTAGAVFVIGSYWGALTLAWLATRVLSLVPAEYRRELLLLGGLWTLLMLPIFWMTVHFQRGVGTGFAVLLWLVPIVHYTLPTLVPQKSVPIYARAVARLKMGKYAEAEREVIEQLERCADDFEGWLMLAELYAHYFHDLAEADRTVRELCAQPGLRAVQISLALHRLADWHLKLAEDPVAARGALEELCRLAPGTHFDRMARQRINQLPASREELREERVVKPIPLPALKADFDEQAVEAAPKLSRAEAVAEANRCVEKLNRDPNHVPARERLARLFAEHLERPEAGIEQLQLLLGLDEPPASRKAEWLALIATWHLRLRRDPPAARKILERLGREYPRTPQALAAQRRIALIDEAQRLAEVPSAAGKSVAPMPSP